MWILSSTFGAGTLELVESRGRYQSEECQRVFDVRRRMSETRDVVTSLSHTVAGAPLPVNALNRLVIVASVEADALFVYDPAHSVGQSAEIGLGLNELSINTPNVKGDVHVVADDMGKVIVVTSPLVPHVAVFKYQSGVVEPVAIRSLHHTVGATAISHDGGIVALASPDPDLGMITLLRDRVGARDVQVDYRTPFTIRWAQRALEAQGTPRSVPGWPATRAGPSTSPQPPAPG
jgi:hypothetical protein